VNAGTVPRIGEMPRSFSISRRERFHSAMTLLSLRDLRL
jgi:hypothetical protein